MERTTLMEYYPYGVRIVRVKDSAETFLVTKLNEDTYEICDDEGKCRNIPYADKSYRLVLYPLGALSSRIDIGGKCINPIQYICDYSFVGVCRDCNYDWFHRELLDYLTNSKSWSLSKDVMIKMYFILKVLHFDLTGSFKKREAINALHLDAPYKECKIPLPDCV